MPYDPIPRTIWMLWLQGWKKAPYVAHQCRASWERHNPGWRVIALDGTDFTDHIAWPYGDAVMAPQVKADLIRLQLLKQYGGVWADATCFCSIPLDDWLDRHAPSGFFAPAGHQPDRVVENWFIAAAAGSRLMAGWCDAVTAFYDRHRVPPELSRTRMRLRTLLHMLFDRSVRGTRLWFHPYVTRLGIFPYLWVVYLFPLLLKNDPRAAAEWEGVQPLDGNLPHRIQQAGFAAELTPELRQFVDSRATPMHKLRWWYDEAAHEDGRVLRYLLDTLPSE